MSPPNSIPAKRLPAPLAQLLKDAGERAGDPQASFLRDFAAKASASQVEPAQPPAPSSENTTLAPVAPISPVPRAAREAATATAGKKATSDRQVVPPLEEDHGWSKKTYRLRPDQYEKLALLQAYLLGDRHARIGASELAREAFDLLFHKYAKRLAEKDLAEPIQEE